MTPLLATRLDMATAVAAVSIPHAFATAFRCWRLRKAIDRRSFLRFGALSAFGGLGGALLYPQLSSHALTLILGALLIATGVTGLTQWYSAWKPGRLEAGALGLFSGLFGGLAGNQGGLRAAALLPFGLRPAAFVATSTAIGLVVDAVRMPVYLFQSGPALMALWLPISVATGGVIVGTLMGEKVLMGLSPDRFRKTVAGMIALLGILLLSRAFK